ncbi:MAG: ABC transporter ATP-binding protein [Desulfobulbaceae bacterium]|nr:ABC transporter ATP-binding protein [Desulfobulbaceae bacterium]
MQHNYGFFEEETLGDVKDAQLWRRILRYGRPHKRNIAFAIFLALTVIATGLALPHLTKVAIDQYITNDALARSERLLGLSHLTMTFLLMVVVGFVANFLQVTLLEWTSQNIMHDLRQRLFAKLLQQEMAFFNMTPTGKLVTRLSNDIQNMNEMFTSVIVTLFNDGVQFLAILVILCSINLRLALMMMALIPFIIINLIVFSRLARDAFRAIRTQLAMINSFLQESLAGISLIQHFLREDDAVLKFKRENQEYMRKNLRQIKLFSVFLPFIEILNSTAIALIIWYGGGQVLRAQMSFGELAAFIAYMRLFFKPMKEISEKYSIVQSAMASAERIFQLLDRDPAIPGGQRKNGAISGQISFTDIYFSYKEPEPVLAGLDLTIAAGETVAIVGTTGSGKTTIINLLERLYEPSRGRISLDGHDLRGFDLLWLRQQIGLVIQDVLLIPGSLRDNICFGAEVSEDRLREILVKAQLTEVVRQLPQGILTLIGEGGYELSTGQKQLLALARVLVRDPMILILDEATANIDSMTEMLVEKALRATVRSRTSILIAHRLSTIRGADRIIVLDRGRIAEEGTYQQLFDRGGLFRTLVEQQRLQAAK